MPQSTAATKVQASPETAHSEPKTTLKCRALQVAIINAPIFGGQREFAFPGTRFDDRLLDIVVIEEMEIERFGRIVTHFFGPRESEGTTLPNGEKRFTHHPAELTHIPGIHHVQAWGVTIMTSADPQNATRDGEVQGQTPMYVHVADQRLRVRIPDQAGTA